MTESEQDNLKFYLQPACRSHLASINQDSDSFFRSQVWQTLIIDFANMYKHSLCTATLYSNNIPELTAQIGIGKTKVLKFLSVNSGFCQTFADEILGVICTEECQPDFLQTNSSQYLSLYLRNIFRAQKLSSIEFNAVNEQFYQQLKLVSIDSGYRININKQSASYRIDLRREALASKPYLAILNHKNRKSIKKTIDLIQQKYGEIKISQPANLEQSLEWFESMTKLNISKYKTKSINSSFENPFLKIFNHKLMTEHFDSQIPSIKQFRAGETIMGYIYGFQYKLKFYVYQSGFDTSLIESGSLGIVCQMYLIEYYREKNYLVYDFLAGDYQYKRSLANQSTTHYWLSLRKPSILYSLDSLLRGIKAYFIGKTG